MTDWPAFVDAWLARAADDRRLRAIGTAPTPPSRCAAATTPCGSTCARGCRSSTRSTTGFDRRVEFGLHAPAEVWERLWAAVPPPRHQSLFALLSKVPEFHVEGSREALAQHAHVARPAARARPPARAPRRARTSRRSPTSAAVTRPLRPRRRWRAARRSCYAEQAGEGRDLLLPPHRRLRRPPVPPPARRPASCGRTGA